MPRLVSERIGDLTYEGYLIEYKPRTPPCWPGSMRHTRFVAATGIREWRYRPERLNGEAIDFCGSCWAEEERMQA